MLQFRKNGYLYTITKFNRKIVCTRSNEESFKALHFNTEKEAIAHAVVFSGVSK